MTVILRGRKRASRMRWRNGGIAGSTERRVHAIAHHQDRRGRHIKVHAGQPPQTSSGPAPTTDDGIVCHRESRRRTPSTTGPDPPDHVRKAGATWQQADDHGSLRPVGSARRRREGRSGDDAAHRRHGRPSGQGRRRRPVGARGGRGPAGQPGPAWVMSARSRRRDAPTPQARWWWRPAVVQAPPHGCEAALARWATGRPRPGSGIGGAAGVLRRRGSRPPAW